LKSKAKQNKAKQNIRKKKKKTAEYFNLDRSLVHETQKEILHCFENYDNDEKVKDALNNRIVPKRVEF